MRRKIAFTIAAVAATSISPADALADKRFSGKTQQRRAVSITTTDDNVLKSGRITWVTRRCALSGSRFLTRTSFTPPFDSSVAGSFEDAGSYTVRQRGGIRSRVTIALAGTYDAATNRWNGSVSARVIVRRDGKTIDRCTLRKTYWTVTPEA